MRVCTLCKSSVNVHSAYMCTLCEETYLYLCSTCRINPNLTAKKRRTIYLEHCENHIAVDLK